MIRTDSFITLFRLLRAQRRGRRAASTLALICVCATTILFPACNVGPAYHKPTVQVAPAYKELTPDQYKEVDGWQMAQPKDDVIRGNWWELYNDPQLNSLEEQLNQYNQNVALAAATFRAARALVWQARSQYFPTVTTSPSASISRSSGSVSGSSNPNSSTGGTGSSSSGSGSGGGSGSGSKGSGNGTGTGSNSTGTGSSRTFMNFSLPFDASWEPDLFGKIHNTVASAVFQAQASAADLANIRLMNQAELAVDYFQLRGLDAQKQLLDATVAAYQKALDLTRALFETGIDSAEDVSQADTQLQTAKAQDIDVGVQRAIFEHAIAVLTGKTPSLFSLPDQPLNAMPPPIPLGIPSELLERRPDIAAAERRVASANAEIGVARAAYYPSLLLTGSGGLESSKIGSLFSAPSLVWSVGASLAQTLFDGGLRRGVSAQAQAVYEETVATYRQSVLTGFQGVEDNLSSLRILSAERKQQGIAVQSAQRTLDLAMERYRTGIDSYLNVITAQNTLYTNQRSELTVRTDEMVSSVQLVLALGGGWSTTQLPSPKEVTSKQPLNP